VTWVAGQGVGQFIDLGCGMPTSPNTHETARAVIPGARVFYLDNDPIVLSHLNALPGVRPGITVLDGDVHDVDKILGAAAEPLDLSAPACLIMGALLHFIPVETGRELVASYAVALAPGSYVILMAAVAAGGSAGSAYDEYSSEAARLYNHSEADFTSFFEPLELVPPGSPTRGFGGPGGPRWRRPNSAPAGLTSASAECASPPGRARD
jgi:O-methyltransferase involved in polyketide biosynthesis